MGNIWFTLYADTFLWLKCDIGLVYNTESKKNLIFSLTTGIEKICDQLLKTENLYTTVLTNDDINDTIIHQWIHSLIGIQAGYLTYNKEFEKRPVSLKPILKVQDKKDHYVWQHTHGHRGEVLQNLHDLTFYINGSMYGNNEYFKQYLSPLKDRQMLDSSNIRSFIRNSQNPFLSNINLVGNLFSFPDFEQFIINISDFSIQCTIHIMIQDILDNMQNIRNIKWNEHINLNIVVDSVFDVSLIRDMPFLFFITVFIFSEDDYRRLSTMLEPCLPDQTIRYIPLYNRQNLHFFESDIYLDKEDLDTIELSKNEIFMRQALNTGNFGKLTVLSDGVVHANVNDPPLGTILDSPYSLVYKEFTEGKSWLKIRDQAPCVDCIYQWLCPSPSNYEAVIGRSNLCHVRQWKLNE